MTFLPVNYFSQAYLPPYSRTYYILTAASGTVGALPSPSAWNRMFKTVGIRDAAWNWQMCQGVKNGKKKKKEEKKQQNHAKPEREQTAVRDVPH